MIFIPINNTLSIRVDRQRRIFIDRVDGGTVEISLSEIRHLVGALAILAADMASHQSQNLERDND